MTFFSPSLPGNVSLITSRIDSILTAPVFFAKYPKIIVFTMFTPKFSSAMPVASISYTVCVAPSISPVVFIITSLFSLIPEKTSTTFKRPSSRTTT